MADITEATGLTKGSIYGNFKNKEELAIAAFHKNINDLLKEVSLHQQQSKSPLQKLFLITDFYKNYYTYSKKLGGCPILNVGVDANNQDTQLLQEVKIVIDKTQNNIVKLINLAIKSGEIKPETDTIKFAKMMYSTIQGAIFMCYTMDDSSYLEEAMVKLDQHIKTDLQKK
jgi:AcrR family transcriptional regulator